MNSASLAASISRTSLARAGGVQRRGLIIRYTDGMLELTEAGAEVVGDCPPAMKDEIAADRWIDAVKPAALIGSGASCAARSRDR